MRLPDSRRVAIEFALRALGVAAMGALAVRFWIGATTGNAEAAATSASLDSALVSWSQSAPQEATLRAATVPDPTQRDWLVALRRTGSRVRWSAGDTTASAVVIEPGPLPGALGRLAVLGPPATRTTISDDLGRVDSIRIGRFGAAWLRLRPLGTLRASLGGAVASTVPHDSLAVKPVLLIGSAGWEAKFVAAALEEDGWTVTARLQVAPGAVVRQGTAAPIDTAAYSALLVIDSVSPVDAGAVSRFVNEGGGLIASGPGVRHPSLRALLPRMVQQAPGVLGGLFGATPRLGLNSRLMTAGMGSVVFERRNGAPVFLARRVGSGRVVASGYDDTWRLRMVLPDENAPALHRDWWSATVGSAAMTRMVPRPMPAVDEAPFAATVAALGRPATVGELPTQSRSPFPWDALLATIAGVALLGEWLSRRLRGVA